MRADCVNRMSHIIVSSVLMILVLGRAIVGSVAERNQVVEIHRNY